MKDPRQQAIIWPTHKGDVTIRSFCTQEEIHTYTFDSRFGTYARYRSLYTKRESLEEESTQKDTNVTLALFQETHIIGFGILGYPDPDERWHKVGSGVMMEIAAIEVCRQWRSAKVAKGIVKLLLAHPLIEEKIAYFVGYSWTWDLDGTRKTAHEYRNMLIRLMEPYGFKLYQTNEPNICLRPENVFMCRVGAHVSEEVRKKFKWVRFNIDPATVTT